MTLLIASVFGHDATELQRATDAALAQGAEAVEVRLDLCDAIDEESLRQLRRSIPSTLPVILTIRSRAEGGAWDGGDDERISRIIELGPCFDALDVELALWNRSANIRQKVELALARHAPDATNAVEKRVDATRRKLILSLHDPAARPRTLSADFLRMIEDTACDVPKIAWRARTVRDNFEAFELMRGAARPAIVICLGDDGLPSRVLAPKFAAYGTFAAVDEDRPAAPGQRSLRTLRETFRWKAVNPHTRVYGLIGDPVAHSLGPVVHNAAFAALGEDAVYLPFRVDPPYESFKAFMVEVADRPWLDVRGLSVTRPHKENALRFLRETGGTIDATAQRVGAVNTLTAAESGRWIGSNTDAHAAIEAIRELTGTAPDDWHGRTAVVLGAGGVARAVIHALTQRGVEVTIHNRTRERAESLARDFSCRAGDWSARASARAWLVVNCTSLGQAPREADSPLPSEGLAQFDCVLDTVYRPNPTRLIREARQSGRTAAAGMTMFLAQAVAQCSAWIGRSTPRDTMLSALSARPEGCTG